MTIRTGQTTAESTFWVLGAAGQLGTALRATAPQGVTVRTLTSADIDVTDAESVSTALADLRAADVLINATAYTAVDRAEDEPELAEAVNARGPELLAQATAAVGAWLIHVSTDYVFAGPPAGSAGAGLAQRTVAYEPDEVDLASEVDLADAAASAGPRSVYGQTKLAGERRLLRADPTATIVRTAWVYTGGQSSPDFVGTMRRLEQSRDSITVVDDQTGSPTYAPDLAVALWELGTGGHTPERSGVLHATNAGSATWWEVARAVFAEVGADPERVQPCTTDEFPRPAPRPAFSVLSGRSWAATGLTPLRAWRPALHAAVSADTV